MALPIPREAPVTMAVLPARSMVTVRPSEVGVGRAGTLPRRRQRRGYGSDDPADDLVEHAAHVRLTDPQVLGAVDADHVGLGHAGEPLPRLGRLEVVVVLGDEGHQRPTVGGPPV